MNSALSRRDRAATDARVVRKTVRMDIGIAGLAGPAHLARLLWLHAARDEQSEQSVEAFSIDLATSPNRRWLSVFFAVDRTHLWDNARTSPISLDDVEVGLADARREGVRASRRSSGTSESAQWTSQRCSASSA